MAFGAFLMHSSLLSAWFLKSSSLWGIFAALEMNIFSRPSFREHKRLRIFCLRRELLPRFWYSSCDSYPWTARNIFHPVSLSKSRIKRLLNIRIFFIKLGIDYGFSVARGKSPWPEHLSWNIKFIVSAERAAPGVFFWQSEQAAIRTRWYVLDVIRIFSKSPRSSWYLSLPFESDIYMLTTFFGNEYAGMLPSSWTTIHL